MAGSNYAEMRVNPSRRKRKDGGNTMMILIFAIVGFGVVAWPSLQRSGVRITTLLQRGGYLASLGISRPGFVLPRAGGANQRDWPPEVLAEEQAWSELPLRTKLVEFYQLHAPEKVDDIDMLIDKYEDQEVELFRALVKKYKVPIRSLSSADLRRAAMAAEAARMSSATEHDEPSL